MKDQWQRKQLEEGRGTQHVYFCYDPIHIVVLLSKLGARPPSLFAAYENTYTATKKNCVPFRFWDPLYFPSSLLSTRGTSSQRLTVSPYSSVALVPITYASTNRAVAGIPMTVKVSFSGYALHVLVSISYTYCNFCNAWRKKKREI